MSAWTQNRTALRATRSARTRVLCEHATRGIADRVELRICASRRSRGGGFYHQQSADQNGDEGEDGEMTLSMHSLDALQRERVKGPH